MMLPVGDNTWNMVQGCSKYLVALGLQWLAPARHRGVKKEKHNKLGRSIIHHQL